MKRTELRLVTHGEATMPYLDVATHIPHGAGLTPGAVRIARELGGLWKNQGVKIGEFHASPLLACVQTATVAEDAYQAGRMTERRVQILTALNTTPMYRSVVRTEAAQLRGSSASTPESTALDVRRPVSATLQGAGLMAVYLASLQQGEDSRRSIVAVTDGGSVNTMLSLLEIGVSESLNDPNLHLQRTLMREALEPGSETLIVLEGGPDPHQIRGHIEDVGLATWAEMPL